MRTASLVGLISNGDIAQTSFALIQSAESEIISIDFLMRDDEFGLRKMALLREKRRQGKRVVMHVDAFHLMVDPALVLHLIREGVEFTVFNEWTFNRFLQFSVRNHSKMLIIDGRYLKTGDSNTGNEYVHWGGSGQKMKSLDLIVEGPAVSRAREGALNLLKHPWVTRPEIRIASESEVSSQRARMKIMNETAQFLFRAFQIQMDAPQQITKPACLLVTSAEVDRARAKLDEAGRLPPEGRNPAGPGSACPWVRLMVPVPSVRLYVDEVRPKGSASGVDQAVYRFMSEARETLDVVSPYLIPTDEMKKAVDQARHRGARVRFFTNSMNSTDNQTTQYAYEYRLEELAALEPAEILEYEGPETLHAKFIVRDGRDAMVMTYNIDWRSEIMNLENAVEFTSSELADDLGRWLRSAKGRFTPVVREGRLLKTPLSEKRPGDFMRRLLIQSIEKHL